jgi:outer membrane protein OmpA-like peptidoglycan-associated protein
MRRIGFGLIFLSMFFILFTGCASFKPVDLNPRIQSGQLVPKTDNFVVLFDKSASMDEIYLNPERMRREKELSFQPTYAQEASNDRPYRIDEARDVTKNMIATIPETKMDAGLRTFWADKTVMIYGMRSLVKDAYVKTINSIENPNGKTPMASAITAAGNDLKGAQGRSAIIIVSDFSELPGIEDIKPEAIMKAITKVNADYGDKLCVYAIQIGYTPDGKELAEQIVQNVTGGYSVNSDKLATPAGMAAFVEKVITGNCSRYQEMAAKPKEKVVIVAAEPMVDEKVVAAAEVKAEEKVIVLAFEDVHFDFDKSTLTPEAQAILKRDVKILKDNPKARVRIAGYTSAAGTPAYNQKLSERRANAVRTYLINEGIITPDRLSTIGYGEADPAMYEASPKELYSKAAKANMRVLFEIVVK